MKATSAGLLLVVALVVLPSFTAFTKVTAAAYSRRQSYDVLLRADTFLSALRDAEIGERGYALTGDVAFLEPYLAVREGIADQLAQLSRRAPNPASQAHLAAVLPIVTAKLEELANVVELRRTRDESGAAAAVRNGAGKRLMDSIRAEMGAFVRLEKGILDEHESVFQSEMRFMLATIGCASLVTTIFAWIFAVSAFQQSKRQVEAGIQIETKRLLMIQTEANQSLERANEALAKSEESLSVTLLSIGDAVIATNTEARVTRLNPIAERLTGWSLADAMGRAIDDIFVIINKGTRQAAAIPVMSTLAKGTVHGLANHTVLIARDGTECDIADSCAPIRDRCGVVVGAVLVFRNVTEQYALQQSVADSAALTSAILNTVADGVVTLRADGGVVESVNLAAQRMFGCVATDCVGHSLSRLIPELIDGTHSDLGEYCASGLESRANGVGRELIGRRGDGSTFPVEMTVSEMYLGGNRYFTGILRDITFRKRADVEQKLVNQRLREQQFYTRSLIESNVDALVITDPNGNITDVNRMMVELTGCTRDELIGAPFKHCFTDPNRAAECVSVALVAKHVTDFELTVLSRNGSTTAVSYNASTIYNRERQLQGIFAAARDITERQLAHQALQRANAELEIARSDAEKANAAKSDFLSSMSHELRSPLNAILGFAQLLESEVPPPSESQKQSISHILVAGWHLLNLINEVLDLAVVEAGKVSLSPEAVALDAVLTECQTMLEPEARKRGISMAFPHFETVQFVYGDRTRIRQVLINLLTNAIKYNKVQGTVDVECHQVSPERVRINVIDTGSGISASNLSQLFQPFNRLGQEAEGGVAGTGIGLVVTERLVKLMGGAISVESNVGIGSMFSIELPAASAPVCVLESPTVERGAGADERLSSSGPVHTLLYVEDDPANVNLIEQLIARRPNFRLLTAGNGTLGLEIARKAQPMLILMDINLPGINGVEALALLREDPSTAHIPVVAISSHASPRDIQIGLESGFHRYLTKPIKINEFMGVLDAVLMV